MIVAKSEKDIIDNSDSKGATDCALKAFRLGKKVLICNCNDNHKEVTDYLLSDEVKE